MTTAFAVGDTVYIKFPDWTGEGRWVKGEIIRIVLVDLLLNYEVEYRSSDGELCSTNKRSNEMKRAMTDSVIDAMVAI